MKRRWEELDCPYLNRKHYKIESTNRDYKYLNTRMSEIVDRQGLLEREMFRLIDNGDREIEESFR